MNLDDVICPLQDYKKLVLFMKGLNNITLQETKEIISKVSVDLKCAKEGLEDIIINYNIACPRIKKYLEEKELK